MKIGFIGLGNIGSVMAANLIRAGHALTVHDLRPAAGEKLVAAGASWAESRRQAAAAVDTVITSLPGPSQVRAVVEGEQGVIDGLRAGRIRSAAPRDERQ